ncbi:TPA: hypothetical protein HA318_05565 [Candidatus Micrarchaeota archaeon]|nr:MAG: hypothetical protein AUJ65_00210 [Candidatus Micrarchaeota archaeon CG1_02_51_15]HII39439.1 hypothetical protein [Candidatus Micrarchaeota archaeon]
MIFSNDKAVITVDEKGIPLLKKSELASFIEKQKRVLSEEQITQIAQILSKQTGTRLPTIKKL